MSLLLIVTFCHIYLFPPHWWVRPLVDIDDHIVNTFMRDHIITLYHHWFYPITMASFHRHPCYIYIYIYIYTYCFLPRDECDQSLVSLITLEVIFWTIISLLYWYTYHYHPYWLDYAVSHFFVIFIAEQWRPMTITSVYCCFVFFLCFRLVDECDHSSWSLILYQALWRAIISLLYIIISYMTPIGSESPCHII